MNRHTFPTRKAAWAALATAAALCLALAPAASAADIADVRAGAGGLDFVPQVEHGGFVLTVSGPEGFHHRAEFGAGESPSFSIFDHGGALPDGVYNYELTAVPSDTQRRDAFEANQIQERSGGVAARIQTGAFSVVGGAVVAGGETEPGQTPAGSGPVLAEKTTILTTADGTIISSLCVGIDCTSSESFGFDTIRLKENNTRIKFEDTSVGTFPSTDWQLTANDSASGGQNKFSIEDVTTPRVPFTIEGGSTTNSIYVDSTGRVGFRTSTPVLDLHVATSNTPGLRLEQTNAGGFTAQTWDVSGNEANFFVRSATTGSQLPFRIRPGAPTSSIDISASGNVGIGTSSPSEDLHVHGTDGGTQLLVEEASTTELERDILSLLNNGNTGFLVEDTSADGSGWQFKVSGPSFRINKNGTGGDEIVIRDRNDTTGQATLVVNGSVQATNVTFSSSRSLKAGFEPVDVKEVLAKVAALPVSEWQFKTDASGRRHVGPIAEDFHEAFGLGNSPAEISAIDASGVTMAAVQGLQQELQEVVSQKDRQIEDLRLRVEHLEELLRSRIHEP